MQGRWLQGLRDWVERSRRWRAPIGPLLIVSSGGLVLVAVSTVLVMGFLGITSTIAELGREKGALVATIVETRLSETFDAVSNEARLLADMTARQGIDPLEDEGFVNLLAGGLAGAPALTALDYLSADGTWLRVTLHSETGIAVRRTRLEDPEGSSALSQALSLTGPSWGAIFWDQALRQPLLNYRVPMTDAEGRRGVLVAVVSVANLSLAFNELYRRFGVVPFILLNREFVLAHPNLARGFEGGSAARPLPRLDEVGDPVLAAIWETGSVIDRLRSERVFGGSGHLRRAGDTTHVYVYREVRRPDAAPWMIGSIVREDSLDAAIDRTGNMVAAGLAILVLAVMAAGFAARRLSLRLSGFAGLARRIRVLDIEDVPELPRSGVREIDDTARAMNQMADAMRWFVTYVPRSLVRRLIRMGDKEKLESENRVLTVMFTDIVGFTSLSEEMRADEVARYLNRHFALLEDCVEASDGTVDKILGDGLMVFWGAPDEVRDHARRGCTTALAIAEAVKTDNVALRAEGLPPIILRVGLHTGPVTVGNIGGSSRVNYTIVGDTVNTAQRISDHVRELPDRDEITILVSGETQAAAGGGFSYRPEQEVRLRGQLHPTALFRLLRGTDDGQQPAGDS